MIDYGNEKLNQIFRDTWPNLGWAKRMTEPIHAKVSDEDFQKIVEAFDNPQPYPDAMFEEAERREKERKALDAEEMLDAARTANKAVEEAERREKLNAGFKQNENGEWYRPELKDLTRNERIELAEKEIAYIVMGGQDGREYADSIAFVLMVLDSLRDD